MDVMDVMDVVDNRAPGTGLRMWFMVCAPTNTRQKV